MSSTHPVDSVATIQALADKARWTAVPFRRAFVQLGPLQSPQPGPLADLVTHHDLASFDTYALVKLIASAAPYDVEISPKVFARALQVQSPATISKAIKRLTDRHLIQRHPTRRPFVRLLREDGTGAPYTPPGAFNEPHFQLPIQYWLAPEAWHRTLSLPEKAMLFVALTLVDDFVLPYDRAPDWYGLSPSTAERGLVGLQRKNLLKARKQFKPAPLAPRGYTELVTYTLAKPFGPNPRRKSKPTDTPVMQKEVVA